jgi:membrane associated rhomboid family serine protease
MSNPEPTNNANPILSYYREWADKTPYVTRSLMIVLIVSYIVSLFVESDKLLGNTPFFTILNYEVYRLILSPLVDNSIFNIVLVALFFPGMGGRMENGLGSSSFLFLMGTLTLVTNVAFVAVCLCLYYIGGVAEATFYDCSGFWVILFGLITIECLQVHFL